MARGQLVESSEPSQLLKDLRDPRTQAFCRRCLHKHLGPGRLASSV